MSASTSTASTKQQLRTVARAQRRHMTTERKRQAARQRAEWQEQQDEKIAPRAQRITVYARDGVTVLRGPRLERDGVTMIRSNPIKRLAARSRKKEFPTIGPVHQAAAERLLVDWEEGHGGISFGCANYGERTGGVTPKTGYISDAVIDALAAQTKARQAVVRVQERLGALWPVIHAVVICNIDPNAWGEAQGMNAHMSVGYTVAALDLLVQCYQPRKPAQFGKIRMAEFTTSAEREAAD